MGSQNNTHATELHEAEKVFDMIFVSSHQSAEVVQLGEQSLDLPSMSIPAQRTTILSRSSDAIILMRRDHVDALRLKLRIQPVAVVGAIADQSLGWCSDKALLKGTDVIAGQIDLVMAPISTVPELVRTGRLRALGVTSNSRSPIMPDVPTIHEGGIRNFNYTTWYGLLAAAGTPGSVISVPNWETRRAGQTLDMREKPEMPGMVDVHVPFGNKYRAVLRLLPILAGEFGKHDAVILNHVFLGWFGLLFRWFGRARYAINVYNIDILCKLPRLRELGAAPVVEAPDGTVHIARPDAARARTPKEPRGEGVRQARDAARVSAVVTAIRAGDATVDRAFGRGDVPRARETFPFEVATRHGEQQRCVERREPGEADVHVGHPTIQPRTTLMEAFLQPCAARKPPSGEIRGRWRVWGPPAGRQTLRWGRGRG